ncbi:hypothetical protein COO60DRAFT_521482 [Scenedesmus sp. NREL 46B-D3]|nr:hypothetical protein COO60DRAFT_521482 [Scenedesmus sp. NREL 46B-D3]
MVAAAAAAATVEAPPRKGRAAHSTGSHGALPRLACARGCCHACSADVTVQLSTDGWCAPHGLVLCLLACANHSCWAHYQASNALNEGPCSARHGWPYAMGGGSCSMGLNDDSSMGCSRDEQHLRPLVQQRHGGSCDQRQAAPTAAEAAAAAAAAACMVVKQPSKMFEPSEDW